MLTSKGGVAAALALDGQSVAFVSCHLDAGNKFEERRAQYREISAGLGAKLGCEEGADLAQCFHHVVWAGDMNYRCVQVRTGGAGSSSAMGVAARVPGRASFLMRRS